MELSQKHKGDTATFPPPLTSKQVAELKEHYGPNVVSSGKKTTWYRVLFNAFVHPFNILLCILAAASGATEDFDAMTIMLIMVVLSASLRFLQEWRSEVSAQGLKSMISYKTSVIRSKASNQSTYITSILTEDIVPGDWVQLSPGDLIPADLQIITSKDMFISQASLTGEAIPVEKYANGIYSTKHTPSESSYSIKHNSSDSLIPNKKSSCSVRVVNFFKNLFGLRVDHQSNSELHCNKTGRLLDHHAFCFMGTSVVSGTATAFVCNTGSNTYFGSMATELAKRRPQNAFQLGVRRISWIFFIVMACLVPPVLLMQGFMHKNWKDAFLFALSVSVGLTPEMLPMIVNTTLAKGAMKLSKRRCIVRNLDAVINLGGIDILCTDKTGTLTENKVVMIRHVDGNGISSFLTLQLAFLNAFAQTGHKNLLDVAVVEFYQKLQQSLCTSGNPVQDLSNIYTKTDEIPFDFVRRRISVIFQNTQNPEDVLFITKGAAEEVLSVCTHIYFENGVENIDICKLHTLESTEREQINVSEINSSYLTNLGKKIQPITSNLLEQLMNLHDIMNKDGFRVVAVAYKNLPQKYNYTPYDVSTEAEMIFVGFMAFLDPPKESTSSAIKDLMLHNVNIKVLTGDSAVVCQKVCEQINLPVHGIVTSNDLQGKSDNEISSLVETATIFAKMTPLQKAQIIRVLKKNDHIVGFLGDGINDSLALVEADVGISVDTGADIAKESANIILLEKDLTALAEGVVNGRKTYGNTLKYIVMVVSSNFGNVFSMLVASAWLPFLPMKPIHLLAQNLLYDVSQIAIPWDNIDPEFVMIPHRWSMKSILRFMVWMGPWSSVFDITTFLYMYYYFGIQTAEPPERVTIFQTAWFTVGLLTQTLIVHMIRTPKIPFFQSVASISVVCLTILIMGVGLSVPYIPFVGTWLEMVHLPSMFYPCLVGTLLAYCVMAQVAKMIYLRLFKEWF